jgi:glycosyltransferase involved in cell wall biosynthesis
MPAFVDRIYVVDDGSADRTAELATEYSRHDPRVRLISHPSSRGVGSAISSGYRAALEEAIDVVAVMAGDGQMDPADLNRVVAPVASGLADYGKGNRFTHASGSDKMPRIRRFGNFILSILTKFVSGYWHVSDTQSGYTAISCEALRQIDVERIYPGYGCPNDILIKLNIADLRVVEVPINALYGVGELSKMRIPRVVVPIVAMLCRQFMRRLISKYIITSGHPLVLAYFLACSFLLVTACLGGYILLMFIQTGIVMKAALIAAGVCLGVGLQLLLSAVWMDYEANRHLCIRLRGARTDQEL